MGLKSDAEGMRVETAIRGELHRGCLGKALLCVLATGVLLFSISRFDPPSRSSPDEPASSRNIGRVHTLCGPAVERLTANTFRWLVDTGIFEWRFTHTRPTNVPNVTTHLGDGIEFQNGFGAWVRHVYECDFDHSREAVVAVRARQGRLP